MSNAHALAMTTGGRAHPPSTVIASESSSAAIHNPTVIAIESPGDSIHTPQLHPLDPPRRRNTCFPVLRIQRMLEPLPAMWLSTLALGIAQHGPPLHCAFGQLFRCEQRLLEYTFFQQRKAQARTFNQTMTDVVHGLRTGYTPCTGCTYRSKRLREDPAEEHGPPCPKCGTLKLPFPRALWNQADAAPSRHAPYTIYRGVAQDMFALTPPPGRILRAPIRPTGIEFPDGLAGHFSFRLCFHNSPHLHCFTQWPITIWYQEAHWQHVEERDGYALRRAPELIHLSPLQMKRWEVRVTTCRNWVVCEGEV